MSFSHDNGIKIAKVRALDFASKFFQGPSANLSMRRCTSGLQRIISFPSELNSWFRGRGFSSAHRLSRSMRARLLTRATWDFYSFPITHILSGGRAHPVLCSALHSTCASLQHQTKNTYFYFHLFPKVSQLRSERPANACVEWVSEKNIVFAISYDAYESHIL